MRSKIKCEKCGNRSIDDFPIKLIDGKYFRSNVCKCSTKHIYCYEIDLEVDKTKCRHCGKKRLITEFTKPKDNQTINRKCLECRRADANERYQKSAAVREQYLKNSKKWREEHPDKYKEIQDRYRKSHLEQVNARQRAKYKRLKAGKK